MKTHEKCWRLLTLRIGFREKHRQILLGDFRKGLDITLCLKEQGKHSYCTWTGVKYSSQSQQMKRRAKHPRCPISAVYKELFLLVKTEKSFCFESQAGEQRRLVFFWGISPCQTQPFPAQHQVHQMCHQHRECLPCLGKRAFPCSVEAAPLPCQTQLSLSPDTSASRTQELPYRFVLQLLQEVLSWMPRYFQDLGQLIQVWQAVLKITIEEQTPTPAQPAGV